MQPEGALKTNIVQYGHHFCALLLKNIVFDRLKHLFLMETNPHSGELTTNKSVTKYNPHLHSSPIIAAVMKYIVRLY